MPPRSGDMIQEATGNKPPKKAHPGMQEMLMTVQNSNMRLLVVRDVFWYKMTYSKTYGEEVFVR